MAEKLDRSIRQGRRAGEKFFVDYNGQTVPIVDAQTGEVREAQLFFGVMGSSNQSCPAATWTQSLVDWTGSHMSGLSFSWCSPSVSGSGKPALSGQ